MASGKRDLRHARRLGAHLRRLREAKGLTAAEVAKQAGFTQQQISQVERGAINTPIETLARIAQALGMSWRDCLPDNGDSSTATFILQPALPQTSGRKEFMHLGYVLGYFDDCRDSDEPPSYTGLVEAGRSPYVGPMVTPMAPALTGTHA